MNHTFSKPILIPIEHSVNSESIGNTRTVVVVCEKCGLVACNEPFGWWNDDYNSDCPGVTDEAIATRYDILAQYKKRFEENNKDKLDKYNKWLGYDRHKGTELPQGIPDYAYNKKVEWDEEG